MYRVCGRSLDTLLGRHELSKPCHDLCMEVADSTTQEPFLESM